MINKILLPTIILLAFLAGFFILREKQNTPTISENKYKTISADEFSQLARDESSFVLDVHTPEQEHIPSTDAFIPYDDIENNLNKLPKDKSTPILVYCRSGSMSKFAAEDLVRLGYTKVYDLDGGINAYKAIK